MSEVNSNLATLIRTVVFIAVTSGIVTLRSEWEPLNKLLCFGVPMLVFSDLTRAGLSATLPPRRSMLTCPLGNNAQTDDHDNGESCRGSEVVYGESALGNRFIQ